MVRTGSRGATPSGTDHRSTIRLTPDWMQWKETPPVPVLEPERAYEAKRSCLDSSANDRSHDPGFSGVHIADTF